MYADALERATDMYVCVSVCMNSSIFALDYTLEYIFTIKYHETTFITIANATNAHTHTQTQNVKYFIFATAITKQHIQQRNQIGNFYKYFHKILLICTNNFQLCGKLLFLLMRYRRTFVFRFCEYTQ